MLIAGRAAEVQPPASFTIRGRKLEAVSQFKYLGSIFTADKTVDAEIANRIANATGAFARLHKAKVWTSRALPLPSCSFSVHTDVSLVIWC